MRRGLVAAALGVAGVGAALGRAMVVVLAVVPLSVLAVESLRAPNEPTVAIERDLSTEAPALGDRVTVRVTVENEGATMADCLIADSLPDGIDAIETPQRSVRLPAGATTTLEYAVVARRGIHEFGPVSVTARGPVSEATTEAAIDSSFDCQPSGRPLSVRASVTRRVGDRTADTGGSGVEFHSVREYRPSDSQRRVDWRRFARTGELTTVQFRQESATTVYLLVDVRESCAVRGRAADPTALSYAVDATERLAYALLSRGIDVGVGLYPTAVGSLPPGGGNAQRTRIERLLGGHESLPWGEGVDVPTGGVAAVADGGDGDTETDGDEGGGEAVDGVVPTPLRNDARVLFVSPCLDDRPVEFVRAIGEAGGDIGVLAVDVGGNSPGAVVERALREERLSRVDAAGVPLVDWQVTTPLSAAVEEVFTTWM